MSSAVVILGGTPRQGGRIQLVPGLQLAHQLTRGVGPVLVRTEGHRAERVQIVRNAIDDVCGRLRRAAGPRGEREAAGQFTVAGPHPGQGCVEQLHQVHGIGPGGVARIRELGPGLGGSHGQSGHQHGAVAGQLHRLRAELKVVHTPFPSGLQGGRRVAHQRARLRVRQWTGRDQGGQGHTRHRLGDEVGGVLVVPHP